MRSIWLACLLPFALLAQGQSPGALVAGVLLEWDAGAKAGQLSVRDGNNEVFRYRFDEKTHVERDGQMIDVARLHLGDKVEVLSELPPAGALRYAMTVHVLPPELQPPLGAGRYRAFPPAQTRSPLAGNLSYTGVVISVSESRIVLRMRDGEKTILLRPDTKYTEAGTAAKRADLEANTRVYVDAGRTVYGESEAYQVIWGAVLQPR